MAKYAGEAVKLHSLRMFFMSGKIDVYFAINALYLLLVNKMILGLWSFNPKRCGLFGGVLFGEMKFVLSNFLSNEDLSISYES